jgi:ADP-ribose diphosphatase
VGDEPEPIEVVQVPLVDLADFCLRADVCEGRSIAALFLVREWLSKSENKIQ